MFNRDRERRYLPDAIRAVTEAEAPPIQLDDVMEERLKRDLTWSAPAFRYQRIKWDRIRQGVDRVLAEVNAASPEDLAVLLANKIAFQRPVMAREKQLIGRWINRLTAENIGRIELQGRELRTLLVLAGLDVEQAIEPDRPYLIGFEVAENLHDKLQAWLAGRTDEDGKAQNGGLTV